MNAHAARRRLAHEHVKSVWRQLGKDFSASPEDFDQFQESVEDLLADWAFEDARERAEHGHDDAHELLNCDDAGTGEGRYFGRI